ncbi:multisubunit Na+/H+ antiporter, MnhG subunit [Corynebacterium mustelae]|uniref:Multisubunit Na+/H+ antiporter, MnhG subunit n=1 Tax=Corynebacterium mustelae TaxID=571915 RepID=A0A0G3GTU1_9CORY|nr:Na+/H+ antiporter subunit G [Corynebacterium mustelae]AKK04544.1 multisubunit Na+/H+ antiporter, MnhG subunit [Corynebacterium mustelae]
MIITEIIAGVCIVIAGLLFLLTVLAYWRYQEPLTQANLMGPATSVGLPLLIVAKLIYDIGNHGLVFGDLIRAVLSITGYLVVLAVGSFIAGRSLYAVATEEEEPSSR